MKLSEIFHGDDDHQDGLNRAMEDGIQDELETDIGHALQKALNGQDFHPELDGGGGFGTVHDYNGTIEVHGVTEEKFKSFTKEKLEAIASKSVTNDYVEKTEVKIVDMQFMDDDEPAQVMFNLEIQVTFQEPFDGDNDD